MILLITGILLQFFLLSFLSNETTVIEYIQDQEKYCALVYSEDDPDKKHRVELCSVSELDRIDVGVEIYRGKNSVPLYNLLVKPLEQYMNKKVVFKPVGKIHFINMAALVDSSGRRLCDKYRFRRVSSTEHLPSKDRSTSVRQGFCSLAEWSMMQIPRGCSRIAGGYIEKISSEDQKETIRTITLWGQRECGLQAKN